MLVNLKALGLNTSPNQLDAGDGALTEASNIIIRRDNVIESRRGFKIYGDAFGTSTDRAKQLMEYKDRILRHYATKIQYDDGQGNFQTFAGDYSEVLPGLRIKYIQANRNLYFTTLEGVQKISAKTASEFTTAADYIVPAGGLKALDISGRLKVTLGDQSGFLPQDSAVAYRQVWGRKDANQNLILGTPSQRVQVYNPLKDLIIRDYMRMLGALDDITDNTTTAFIGDGNYVETLKLPISATAQEVQAGLLSLGVKLDEDILYGTDVAGPLTISTASITAGVCTINFSAGDATQYLSPTSRVFLDGFVVTGTGDIDGAQVLSTVAPTQITFNTTATGTVAVTGSKIESYEFRYLNSNVEYDDTTTDLNNFIIALPATNTDLSILQAALQQIIFKLQTLPDTVITAQNKTDYVDELDITTTASVILRFTIPSELTSSDFYQIYRSAITQATGDAALDDLAPSDELQLVYEAFPTSSEITQGYIEIEDVTPDAFRGANLYTNASTGEGILQANDVPPWCTDINQYKGYVFFANTRTRYQQLISLLGVTEMIVDYNNSITPTITISTESTSNTYTFVIGIQEQLTIQTPVKASVPVSGYFDVNSANNESKYRFWYDTTGSDVAPADGGRQLVKILIDTAVTAVDVSEKTRDVFNELPQDFSSQALTAPDRAQLTMVAEGYVDDATLGPGMGAAGFVITVTQQGQGEDASNKQVLLSNSASPAVAVDATAKSLIRVINQNSNEIVYGFYLSSGTDVPGKFLLEFKNLNDTPFYIIANNSTTGESFNPTFSPAFDISSISMANPSVIQTTAPHGLNNGDQIIVTNSNSTPSIDGIHTITRVSSTEFSIPVNVTTAGTRGALSNIADVEISDNERNTNRVYYSKFQQPEAVPSVNFLDVGASNKDILRIFPLRDSLFVFKQDGLYRISGETAPFSVALFDSSCILTAADSVDVTNNNVFGWTTQGISTITEAGVNIISRPIDNIILEKSSSKYLNFPTVTWGRGYESDNSYLVFTNEVPSDATAMICYRYSALTNTWTTIDKSYTCGLVLSIDDKLYVGAGDVNFIEQERKEFTRLDYADRELPSVLTDNSVLTSTNPFLYQSTIKLSSVSDFETGDVLTQEQYLSIYEFNLLLKKLDIDQGVTDSDYFDTLEAKPGDNLRLRLVALAQKLDADPGVASTTFLSSIASQTGAIVSNSAQNPTIITTSSPHGLIDDRIVTVSLVTGSTPDVNGQQTVTVISPTQFSIPINVLIAGSGGSFITQDSDFEDIRICYNKIISLLNADSNVQFTNYTPVTTLTLFECVILNVNPYAKQLDLSLSLPFVVGQLLVFKGIKTRFKYCPITFGDPLNGKQIRESTMMFENKGFTLAKLFFSTDLLFQERYVQFRGDGNGTFGNIVNFGTGNYFGGTSHAAPFRTYVPRECQRCRYITVGFEHQVAREKYSIYGLTLTGELTQSSRFYR